MLTCITIYCDLLLVQGKGIIDILDVNEFVQDFSNGICCKCCDFAIGKVNVVKTCVENVIVMGVPNDVSLSIVLAAENDASDKSTATW